MASIPYGRQTVEAEDEAAVLAVLRSDFLTTGPMVERFETGFAAFVGASCAVAVSSGTAALHLAMLSLDLTPGDEVIVPPLTFVATANAVLYAGGTPVFADIDPDTLLIDPAAAAAQIGPRTRAIVGVDYAGQPCDWAALKALAVRHDLVLIADACHAPGGADRGRPVGTLADLSTFSFHPVKHLTTGEGGLIVTDDPDRAARLKRLRNHGIDKDHRRRAQAADHRYDVVELGFNYRLTDLQCALGLAQLGRLPAWLARRRTLAARYERTFQNHPSVRPLARRGEAEHAWHLFVVRCTGPLQGRRDALFAALRDRGIGTAVHYPPVHLTRLYRERLGTGPGLCPVAEAAYEEILSLPIFPGLGEADQDRVTQAVDEIARLS